MIVVNESKQTWPPDSAAFRRSRERYGALSNMTPGMPIVASGLRFSSSEALYQALKFPALPETQRAIAHAANAFDAKRVTWNPNPGLRRHFDPAWWDHNRVHAMAYTIAAKLAAHPQRMTTALRETTDKMIVESSDRDAFWGAKPTLDDTFEGANVLGQLLMQLRDELDAAPSPKAAAMTFADKALKAAPTLKLLGKPLPPL